MSDRTVHAVMRHGTEVVRYDRSGKWWLEEPSGVRHKIDVGTAAATAAMEGSEPRFGLPGGSTFDRQTRANLAAGGTEKRQDDYRAALLKERGIIDRWAK